MDARREAIAATLPPVYAGPEPLSVWQTITVCGAGVDCTITLYVPRAGRCDQHAVTIDGKVRPMVTATEIGRMVASMIYKRPSVAVLGEFRKNGFSARDEEDARRADLEMGTAC